LQKQPKKQPCPSPLLLLLLLRLLKKRLLMYLPFLFLLLLLPLVSSYTPLSTRRSFTSLTISGIIFRNSNPSEGKLTEHQE
jgi:hypothetical protein